MRPELRALFPESVAYAELMDPAQAEPLFLEEEAHIARAVDKRRHEFALGRTCARRALVQLGLPRTALPAHADRSVQWPAQALGSITHADGFCAAVAARRSDLRGLGIDAEVRGRVTPKLWSHIATEREIGWFQATDSAAEANERATVLFSAKEAFYKAQYCITRTFVGFHEVELSFEGAQFQVRLVGEVARLFPEGARFPGNFALLGEHVLTGVVI